jgi:PAS domain S-box-containing protein
VAAKDRHPVFDESRNRDQCRGAAAGQPDFWAVFESAPDAYLLLAPDPPRFTMIAANEARCRATLTSSADVVGRPLFEVFPDNPGDPSASGVRNLEASLNQVLRTGKPHRMALQKYDIRMPSGEFETRYWDPLNSPVHDAKGELIYIIHRVEDVTEQVLSGTRLRILESVVKTANDAVVVTDADVDRADGPHIIYVNDAFARMTGYSPREVLGRTPRLLQGPETDPAAIRRIHDALDRQEPVRVELLNYRSDKSPYWVEISISPVRDETGAVVQWTGVHRETTQRRIAEETARRLERERAARAEEERARHEIEIILQRLRDSERRYRLLVDMIPQNIWTTDARGRHTYFSKRWYDFTGATPEESHGEEWQRFIHPDDRERMHARWTHSLQTGEPYEIEYRFRGRDGNYRWFLGKALPLRNESGDIIVWFGTATHISERKRNVEYGERLLTAEREARAEADRRREELERVTESRTRLMRGFTHDVKNPLGAADGYAQLLQDGILGELSEKQRESIGRIRRSIRTSLNLIHDLLELAKAEQGKLEIHPVSVDLAELAREAAEDFRAQATAAGLSLEVDLPTALPASTDPKRVRQILSNLLSNAVKYTAEGGIRVSLHQGHGEHPPAQPIAIAVSDTGPGIPNDKRETIFQEFTRLDPTARQGAGVGLAISRRIARLLGGDVTVSRNDGHGSTFVLWLPAVARFERSRHADRGHGILVVRQAEDGAARERPARPRGASS